VIDAPMAAEVNWVKNSKIEEHDEENTCQLHCDVSELKDVAGYDDVRGARDIR